MKILHIRALTVIGAALVLMIGGAVAYAAIPSSTGVFTACVQKSSGVVRIIDASKSCTSSEQRVTWNQAGQPGVDGEDGADAPDFAEALYRATGGFGTAIPEGWQYRSFCAPGDKVIGIDGQVINGTNITATSLQIITQDGREGYLMSIISAGDPSGYIVSRCLDLTP